MPLNPRTFKAWYEPDLSVFIDRRFRVPLPRELDGRIGARVYFSLRKDAYGSSEIVCTKCPGRVYQGRLISRRIQRACFKPPRAIVRNKPARNWPRPLHWSLA